eukprot:Pgem_evm1s19348
MTWVPLPLAGDSLDLNGQMYTVIYDYNEVAEGELEVWEGDEVTFLKDEGDGWALVKNDAGIQGLVNP